MTDDLSGRALFDAVMAEDADEMAALAERCHSDDCDHIAELEARVRKLLTANGEMAYLWADRPLAGEEGPMTTLAAMDLDPIRARARAVREHRHPRVRLADRWDPECSACHLHRASQMLADRNIRLALLLSDAIGDRYRLLRRVTELERALDTTIVKLGGLVGTLEEIA